MVFLILSILIVIFVYFKGYDMDMFIVCLSITAGFCLFAITTVGCHIYYHSHPNTDIVYSNFIVSLEKQNSLQGSFVLGSGNINSRLHYYYYIITGNDTYQMGNVSVGNCSLHESDAENPNVTSSQKVYKADWLKWLFFSDTIGENNTVYTITVPKNTIVREYRG